MTTTENLIDPMFLQIRSLESLNENLIKAKTLVDLVLEKELLDYPATLMYYYFAAVSDFLAQASTMNESILANLIKDNAPHAPGEIQ